eukprot:1808295-Amphidinium_carterae.1
MMQLLDSKSWVPRKGELKVCCWLESQSVTQHFIKGYAGEAASTLSVPHKPELQILCKMRQHSLRLLGSFGCELFQKSHGQESGFRDGKAELAQASCHKSYFVLEALSPSLS